MESENKKLELSVRWNMSAIHIACPICGNKADLNEGAELFLENVQSFVCHDCGKKYASDLMEIVEGKKNPLKEIRGQWPGDEPIAELLAALRKNGEK
jgi:transposase-like protein